MNTKHAYMAGSILVAAATVLGLLAGATYMQIKINDPTPPALVGYSQGCFQVGNVLHVVTAKGDTVRLDVSRLEGKK